MLEDIVRAVLRHEQYMPGGITQVSEVLSDGERSWLVRGTCFRRAVAFARQWRVTRDRYGYTYNVTYN